MRAASSVLLAALVAGCVDPAAEPLAAAAGPAALPAGVARLDGAPAARTLASPPDWKTGEWWTLEVHDEFTRQKVEVTKVVVGLRDGRYLVGVPAEEWNGLLLALHLPGLTEVWAANFTTEVHDAPFAPVRFPLEDGASWQTGWHQLVSPRSELTATVSVLSPTTAEVRLTGPGGDMTALYDAELATIARFDFAGYGGYEVVDHGFGYEGPVKVAAGQDVVLLSQRIAAVIQVPGTRPGSPVQTTTVPDGYGEISVSLLAGTFVPREAQVGAYHVEVTAPDGTAKSLTVTSADAQPGLRGFAFEHADPAGDWTVRHAALGPGTTLVEGIAYEPIVVELDGR